MLCFGHDFTLSAYLILPGRRRTFLMHPPSCPQPLLPSSSSNPIRKKKDKTDGALSWRRVEDKKEGDEEGDKRKERKEKINGYYETKRGKKYERRKKVDEREGAKEREEDQKKNEM